MPHDRKPNLLYAYIYRHTRLWLPPRSFHFTLSTFAFLPFLFFLYCSAFFYLSFFCRYFDRISPEKKKASLSRLPFFFFTSMKTLRARARFNM